jgi:hypothetical protein
MENSELLKAERNGLLALHKILVDRERAIYEGINGPLTAGQFLNVLLEDRDFSWLRKISTLIVEIDEMFAQNDGFDASQVESHLDTVDSMLNVEGVDEDFAFRYQNSLQQSQDAAAKHGELKQLLSQRKKAR